MMTSRQSETWLVLAAILLFLPRARRQPGPKPGPARIHPHTDRIPARLSIAQLRELAVAVEVQEPDTAAAIAMAESGGLVSAVGDHGDSIGLWQIHVPSAPKQWANRDMLKNAGFNAQAMAAISNGGTNWEPWTTFRNGSYRKYLPKSE